MVYILLPSAAVRPFKTILALVFFSVLTLARAEFAEAQREVILFSSGRWSYNGYIYKPEGKGPFPAVVWNHGHHDHLTKSPGSEYDELAKLYTREGFVLFIPDRHVHDISRSEYSPELQKLIEQSPKGSATLDKQASEELEINAADVVAAVQWLKTRPYVNAKRIGVSGWSLGACISLAALTKCPDIHSAVLFSPRSVQWQDSLGLRTALRDAVQKAAAPILVVETSDETPSESERILGHDVSAKGAPNRVQKFDHRGYNAQEKSCLAVNGPDTWGYDVLRFFESAMKD